MKFSIEVASEKHCVYSEAICLEMEESARVRGTGIAKRSTEYIKSVMCQGKAVIALDEEKNFAGFSYIESWEHDNYVANSGLIVVPKYRQSGLARQIKRIIFELSRKKYPDAKIFSMTTSDAVLKINSEIGFRPVTLAELTDDIEFWNGCQACENYDVLQRMLSKNRKLCLCTGMLYDPNKNKKFSFINKFNVLKRFMKMTTVNYESDI
jgi:hypothetical protein